MCSSVCAIMFTYAARSQGRNYETFSLVHEISGTRCTEAHGEDILLRKAGISDYRVEERQNMPTRRGLPSYECCTF